VAQSAATHDTRIVRSLTGVVLALALGLALGGCWTTSPSSPSRPLGPGERWLPIVDDHGGQLLCGGVGFVGEFRLHGSAADPQLAWMTRPDGTRQDLVWQVGYSARFTPQLEVLDQHGTVIASEGTLVTGGCGMGTAELVDFTTPRPPDTDDRTLVRSRNGSAPD